MIINGPNLNLLGKRETSVYGSQGFDSYLEALRKSYPDVEIGFFQSNVEGEIITAIQDSGFSYDGIILNAAAYTHTSIGIGDAVRAIPAPVIEVHISNTFSREDFRHKSYIAPAAKGVITGLGLRGYELALISFLPPKI